jgi:thiamine kinase-like enzyme
MQGSEISQEEKDKIAKLEDQNFVRTILDEKLSEHYPDFQKTESIKLTPYKHHIGKTSAVFVIGYEIEYLTTDNKQKPLHLFATGHSDDSRKSAFKKLGFLYNNGFNEGKFQVTRPLFFVEEQKGFFYEASIGQSLFEFFVQDDSLNLNNALDLAAGWVRELHSLPANKDFAWPKFSVADMVPAPQQFLPDFINHDSEFGSQVKRILTAIQDWEKKFNEQLERVLIYGDYHPENVIIQNLETDNLKMIDFTDVALGDPMTDLGTFLQQFDFMGNRFFSRNKINEYKEYFVKAYFGKELEEIDAAFFQRMNLYQAWTALRTAVFLFYMHEDDSVRVLFQEIEKHLELIKSAEKEVNLH